MSEQGYVEYEVTLKVRFVIRPSADPQRRVEEIVVAVHEDPRVFQVRQVNAPHTIRTIGQSDAGAPFVYEPGR